MEINSKGEMRGYCGYDGFGRTVRINHDQVQFWPDSGNMTGALIRRKYVLI